MHEKLNQFDVYLHNTIQLLYETMNNRPGIISNVNNIISRAKLRRNKKSSTTAIRFQQMNKQHFVFNEKST